LALANDHAALAAGHELAPHLTEIEVSFNEKYRKYGNQPAERAHESAIESIETPDPNKCEAECSRHDQTSHVYTSLSKTVTSRLLPRILPRLSTQSDKARASVDLLDPFERDPFVASPKQTTTANDQLLRELGMALIPKPLQYTDPAALRRNHLEPVGLRKPVAEQSGVAQRSAIHGHVGHLRGFRAPERMLRWPSS
jgi:hypothetical protein